MANVNETLNPASEKMFQDPGRPAESCVMTIFGASGDLTKRKLIPALYNLAKEHLMPEHFAIIGFAFDQWTTESFRDNLTQDIKGFSDEPIDPKIWDWFLERIYFVQGDFGNAEAYKQLGAKIAEVSATHQTGANRFFYMAVAPRFFAPIVQQLGAAGLTTQENHAWTRVIVEKPFGRDLASAKQLNHDIRQVLEENQIYRIDHYLGKETVQNLMVFRFANSIFEPVWNRAYIDHVQITAAETVGVEHRGGYYETSGALRDMVPNHLNQLLTLTAMEPPVSFGADSVRGKQTEVLQAVQPFQLEDVLTKAVRGQYGASKDGAMAAYRAEPGVAPDSNTETFVAMKLAIDNWRWADVPFYLRTGKRMADRLTEIAIQFRKTPFVLFRDTPVKDLHTNRLVISIQPKEGITLRFGAKVPGALTTIGTVNMDFDYERYFGKTNSTGYERLLHDCMVGDATLFQRADMVEAGWAVIQPVLDVWQALPMRSFPNYKAGTWGPQEACDLLERDGRKWRHIE